MLCLLIHKVGANEEHSQNTKHLKPAPLCYLENLESSKCLKQPAPGQVLGLDTSSRAGRGAVPGVISPASEQTQLCPAVGPCPNSLTWLHLRCLNISTQLPARGYPCGSGRAGSRNKQLEHAAYSKVEK